MKTIYVAYKFKESDPIGLRKKLEELSKILEETLKCKTFVFFRDAQKWGKIKMNVKEVVDQACKTIEKCDAILVETTEKANGAYFEVGYAKALGKKIYVIHEEGTESLFLEAASDYSLTYKDFNDLRDKLKELSNRLN